MNSRKLKIVFVTADASEQGTYFRWHNIAIGLVKLGHSVQVYSVDNGDNSSSRIESRDGVDYNIINGSKGKSFFGTMNHPLTSFRRIFADFPVCDIAHVFQPFSTVYLPWKYNLRKKAALSLFDWDDLWVDDLRDKEKKDFRSNWDYKIKGYFEKSISAMNKNMTVCSLYLKNLALKRGAKSAEIIPNGFWEYEIPNKQLSRKKLGLLEDAVYFGFMGRTGFELNWCFDALAQCQKQGINVRFALCGPAESVLDNVSPEVRSQIDYLGSLAPLDTRFFSAAIDLGLLPLMKTDFNESRFPIKFAEYMAAGLPVLCSEIGQVSEYGKNFPWVFKAGVTQQDWNIAFINAAKIIIAGQGPKVDLKMVYNVLSWNVIAKSVESVYMEKMNAVK